MEHIAVDIGGISVRMRGLTGRDQLDLGAPAGAGRRLIGRLLHGTTVEGLSIAQRDRLAAALWRHLFGDRIVASHRCSVCGKLFDIAFSLAALTEALDQAERPPEVEEVLADGSARLVGGAEVRPVRGADEAEIESMAPAEAVAALRARAVRGGGIEDAALDRVLAWLDPVIDTELAAGCPECGAAHEIRFSMEHFLIRALESERGAVLRDVDVLARSYGWGLAEILGLSRQERRTLVAYAEAAAARGAVWS